MMLLKYSLVVLMALLAFVAAGEIEEEPARQLGEERNLYGRSWGRGRRWGGYNRGYYGGYGRRWYGGYGGYGGWYGGYRRGCSW